MKVKDLIDMLAKAKPEDEVQIWDGDADDYMPVTGMVYGTNDGLVTLYADDEP